VNSFSRAASKVLSLLSSCSLSANLARSTVMHICAHRKPVLDCTYTSFSLSLSLSPSLFHNSESNVYLFPNLSIFMPHTMEL
jgi:hypothetical protein